MNKRRSSLFAGIEKFVVLIFFVFVLTLTCRAFVEHGFDIALNWKFWHRDYLGNLVLALMAFALIQSLLKTTVFVSVLVVMFQLGNAAKLSILGTPASPDDVFAVQNVFFLTDGWRQAAMFFIAGVPLLLAVAFIAWKQKSVWLSFAALAATGFAINTYSEPLRIALDTHIGNSVWNQPANFRDRGLTLHLTQETIRTISTVEKPPTREVVEKAQQALVEKKSNASRLEPAFQAVSITSDAKPLRNVHVFVLESFFDPVTLGEEWVPEDPLPASFRELWEKTAYTKAMSPVFGGYTANAEFEMLCGFPVTRNAVFFEGWLRRSAPCLPRVLAQAGYNTLASHPNVPGFWNRTNAYQLIGFDTYLSKADFDLSDSVGTLLLDHSMYEQVYDYIDNMDRDAPVFNYMLTYHGHLPYPSNENYPDQVSAGRDAALLNGYLNQIWYKSRDLMQRLDTLQREDPDSLVIIFGDHLPFLGQNYGVYTEAWGLPDDRSSFEGEHLQKLTSTPLIIIDGERGPLQLGDVPLYRLPSIVMSLLAVEGAQSFDATKNPDPLRIRPVYGMHYTANEDETLACTEKTASQESCSSSEAWLDQVKVLTGDVFTGDQFSLEK